MTIHRALLPASAHHGAHADRRPPVSVRAALRAATDAAHQKMHGMEPFQAIADGTLPIERYRQLLRSLLQFHAAVGAAAIQSGCSNLSSAAHRIAQLQSDLRLLGGAAPAPAAAPNWRLGSRYAALGALYAAEGSMLGGRVIARQLDFLFGEAEDGRRFFNGSTDAGARWHKLVATLEEQCAATDALDQAIGGAQLTFALFEQCVMIPRPRDRFVALGVSQPARASGADIGPAGGALAAGIA